MLCFNNSVGFVFLWKIIAFGNPMFEEDLDIQDWTYAESQ